MGISTREVGAPKVRNRYRKRYILNSTVCLSHHSLPFSFVFDYIFGFEITHLDLSELKDQMLVFNLSIHLAESLSIASSPEISLTACSFIHSSVLCAEC